MPNKDPRIDAYIKKSPDFARPILEHLRQLVHKGCPDVQETIKWGHAFFDYKGGPLCNMAAFKQHCSFGFWKASLLRDPSGLLQVVDKESAGHLGRLTSVKDLPADKILVAYIKEAAGLNEMGVKAAPGRTPKAAGVPKTPAAPLPVPAELGAALKKNKKAQTVFDAFPPSHRREYSEWIAEARTAATKDKRVATTIEWLTEGKSRNWKYKTK
jgi:uncharacterized protein YdeI (YjbR/CyaY-like superfamily)